MDQQSQEYFRRRQQVERTAAKKATCEAARRAHLELAQEYVQLLRSS